METNFSSGNSETGRTQDSPTGTARTTSAAGTSGTMDTAGTTGATGAGQSAYSGETGTSGQSGSTLREELANLKRDLDTLMSRAASLTDRELSDARDRLMGKFGTMRGSMRQSAKDMADQAKGVAMQARGQLNQGMDATSEYVRDNPLQSIALAAGVGLLLGALLNRDRD